MTGINLYHGDSATIGSITLTPNGELAVIHLKEEGSGEFKVSLSEGEIKELSAMLKVYIKENYSPYRAR